MGGTGTWQALPERHRSLLKRLQQAASGLKRRSEYQQVAQAAYVMTKQVRPGLTKPERNIEPRVRRGN